MQPTTDDGHHDDALASMIAALNQLDLTLGHLDLDIPKGMDQKVDEVVVACGNSQYFVSPFSKYVSDIRFYRTYGTGKRTLARSEICYHLVSSQGVGR
jgi:ABC-type uncharacterized transport system involved in gliding motility auxiliary subunit